MTLQQLQRIGFATGLTALTAEIASMDFANEQQPYLQQQRDQVAERVERFRPVIRRVLSALADVDVPATPVKGAELINGIWPYPAARPMSDVDVVVPGHLRAQATAALVAAGFTFEGASPHEDTFLAWGDGSVGRTDGESASHNGRVELHLVRRAVVRLLNLQVDVAVGIDRRRDRQHRRDVDVLHRLHTAGRVVRHRLRHLHERPRRADVQHRLPVVLRDDHRQ